MPAVKSLDYVLLTAATLKKAVRAVAVTYGLPTGAVWTLAAVAARATNRLDCRPCHIYSAEIAAPTLVRAYLARLVNVGLVQRRTYGRTKYLTLTGMGLVAKSQLKRDKRRDTKIAQSINNGRGE
jgi:hypothetical protein